MTLDNTQVHENVCPYLGLRYDTETRYGFPNPGNHCHREKNPRPINLDYQQSVCLTYGYQNCPIYLQKNGDSSCAFSFSKIYQANEAGLERRRFLRRALRR